MDLSGPDQVLEFPINSHEWLEAVLQKRCGLSKLRAPQLTHGMDLVAEKDLLLVIATGQGKTVVIFSPVLAADERGEDGVAILVVPTKILVEQQTRVAEKYGLRAYGIHEDTVRSAALENHDLFKELSGGSGIRVGVMSPQMLRGSRMTMCLKSVVFKKLVRWFLVDEAHLVDEQSGTFLEVYRNIAMMRGLLPSSTVWAAVTGSATPDRALTIGKLLGFQPGHYVNARYSTDRPNVKYIPRFFEHSISGSTFLDLSFVIPFGMKSSQEVETTLIFASTISTCFLIMQYLDSLIPSDVPDRSNIIKLYNSLMHAEYRQSFIEDITSGKTLRVGVVTDTCTYGFDVPNIRRVIVFDLCPSPEILKQKIGRGGRDGHAAVAITYAPAWVREVPISDITGKQAAEDRLRREKLPPVTQKWYNPQPDLCSRDAELAHNGEVFSRPDQCCATHSPEPEESRDRAMVAKWENHFQSLPTEAKPGKALRSDGTFHALETAMKNSLRELLIRWRGQKWASVQDRKTQRGLPSDFFMPQHVLEHILDRAHVCTTLERLKILSEGWDYFDDFGIELLQYLTKIMEGFNAIFTDRETATDLPRSTPAIEEDITVTVAEPTPPTSNVPQVAPVRKVRLLMGSSTSNISSSAPPMLIPAKRSSLASPQQTRSQNAPKGKENKRRKVGS